jgi:anti-sigma regulatory factor (Ser/Thr protein kinase)
MLGGVAELLAFDPELLDDLKTAVSEACNNVVLHAYPGTLGPLVVFLYVRGSGIDVLVRDQGNGIADSALDDDRMQGVGIPVIRALTASADFTTRPEGGTDVWMTFAAERDGERLFEQPADPTPDNGWSERLAGDAVVSVSPVTLLTSVLGRVARALAANARFSLDRFSDVYLVTDAIAAHASIAARHQRIGFAIEVGHRQLELTIGPFRAGSGTDLNIAAPVRDQRSPLALLTDELSFETFGDDEMLRAVLIDHRDLPTD